MGALFSVPNINAILTATTTMGGRVVYQTEILPNRGRQVVLRDNFGAVFGFMTATGGDPDDNVPEYNEWIWPNLWTDDLEGARRFYEIGFGVKSLERFKATLSNTEHA